MHDGKRGDKIRATVKNGRRINYVLWTWDKEDMLAEAMINN